MMSKLNLLEVSCVVPKVYLGDPLRNAQEIIKKIKEIEDSSIIVFPELSLTGYTCGDLFFQKKLIAASQESLVKVAEETKESEALIIVGLPLSLDGRLYNVAAALQCGKILGIVPKIFIPDNEEYYEKRWFCSGIDLETKVKIGDDTIPVSPYLLFDSKEDSEIKVGIEICEDLWALEPPSNRLAAGGALIICNPSASSETILKSDYRLSLVSQQSARLNCAYLYVSSGYGESTQDLVFGGDAIIAERGKILAQSERFRPQGTEISAQIDLDILLHNRRIQASYRDSLGEETLNIPVSLTPADTLKRNYPKNPFVPSQKDEREARFEEILNIQSMGLGTRLNKIGDNTRMVIGVSGGLDSTLALLAAANTCKLFGFDPKRILAVTMPGFGTTDRTYDNAVSLIKEIGAEFKEIPIAEAVKGHLKDIGHSLSDKDETYENAQARERTQILMDLANDAGGIVVGTGDLSELALGWCTYNGDHMAMYGVNAGIPKTLVRYLVDYYSSQSEEDLKKILNDILETPVSPELLPPDQTGKISQKTEEKIGPYELHDFFLFHLLRSGYTPEKIFEIAKVTFKDEYSEEEIRKWLKLFLKRFYSQQYKRSTLPDGPKVGSVSLSPRGDWRMPSDIGSNGFLSELD